ncbi:MAG: helix-turn-helix transcriptional regulator [Bryobacteraceae bacterium]|jgi:transcriptional regulator with XRE-family HTH domain
MPKVSRFELPPVDFGGETLGQRIARIRKERGFTQVELAGKIGIIQPIVSSVEGDERKLFAEMAVRFAQALDVSMDELLGPGRHEKKGRKPSRKILRRLERIETLPRTQQIAVLKTIDNAIELHTLKTGTR